MHNMKSWVYLLKIRLSYIFFLIFCSQTKGFSDAVNPNSLLTLPQKDRVLSVLRSAKLLEESIWTRSMLLVSLKVCKCAPQVMITKAMHTPLKQDVGCGGMSLTKVVLGLGSSPVSLKERVR